MNDDIVEDLMHVVVPKGYPCLLFDFPFLSNWVIVIAYKEFYRPENQCEEDIHPSPPDLGGMIEDYRD